MPSANYVSPEWSRSALLLIDVQKDFVSGSAIVDGTAERLPAMARLSAAFRAARRPVIHIVRLYQPGGSDVDSVRRSTVEAGAHIAAPGTWGAQIPDDLLPRPVDLDSDALLCSEIQPLGRAEFILYKPRWSAFYRTTLDTHLSTLGISTVVVAGCNLPNCPRATLFDASERDYRTVLVTDATSQGTPERLADLAAIGVNLLDTDDVVTSLAPPGDSTQRPVIPIVAAVIVDDNGHVLVVRKRGTTAFMQPGGKLDPGETGVEAITRELAEELDVTVAASDVSSLGRHVADAANEPGHVVHAELFMVTLRSTPRASAEIEELRWIDPGAPCDVELAPLTRHPVLALLRGEVVDQGASS